MRAIQMAFTLAATMGSAMIIGCTKRDTSTPAAAVDSAQAAPAATTTSAPAPSDITPVRGRLAVVSDSTLTVATTNGDVRVTIQPPLHIYTRDAIDLSKVTEHSFVGVTSVTEPDGTQRATEIHLFPEELRGTGEGSYLMAQQAGATARSTMTNGTVAASPSAGAAPRMTNGTIAVRGGSTLTVQYRGGSQTITIPKGVSVTALVPTETKLTVGANVVVLGKKQADGTLRTSGVLLAGGAKGAK